MCLHFFISESFSVAFYVRVKDVRPNINLGDIVKFNDVFMIRGSGYVYDAIVNGVFP